MALYDYSYRTSATPFRAYQKDKRFSYTLYVPDIKDWNNSPIIVTIHGTDRTAETYRDRAIALAEKHRAIVLSPLFPAGVGTPEDIDDYKLLEGHGIRYDILLLDMISEVVEHYGCRKELYLFGFSGGGQFVHRFVMLYPGIVRAVSIGAPGLVTLPRTDLFWWPGIGDVEQRFNINPNWDTLKKTRVQMLVGEQDTDLGEITIDHDDPLWIEGADSASGTRIERLIALRDAWEKLGIPVEFETVPKADHEGEKIWSQAEKFFDKYL